MSNRISNDCFKIARGGSVDDRNECRQSSQLHVKLHKVTDSVRLFPMSDTGIDRTPLRIRTGGAQR